MGIKSFISSIPSSALTAGGQVRASTSTREELQIARGIFYSGSSQRLGVPVGNTYRSVISAPADRYLILEGSVNAVNFSDVTDGKYSIQTNAYSSLSNSNSYTYAPASPIPVGRPLNTSHINTFPTSTIDLGVTINDLTGDSDYFLFFEDYFIDVSGNRSTISSTGADFFDQGRQIVIAPNSTMVFETLTTGNAVGSATLRTVFFTSEVPATEYESKYL